MSYGNDSVVRDGLHQEIFELFDGVYNTDSDTSQVSLDLSEGDPKIRVIDGYLRMFYGSAFQYSLEKIGQLETNDRVVSEYGSIPLSDDVIKVYKALNRALHERNFRLTGKFDCANMFLRQGLTSDQWEGRPKVEADWPWPYYFESSSPIRGRISFRRHLPSAGNNPHRRVCIVNVKTRGNLGDSINDGTVVYLAGDHDDEHYDDEQFEELFSNRLIDESFKKERSMPRRTKYAFYGKHARRGKDAVSQVVLSSPFPKTFGEGLQVKLNLALAKTRMGYFYYWTTDRKPSFNAVIDELALNEIPAVYHGIPEGCEAWGRASLHEDVDRLAEIFEGAWVLQGNRLVEHVNEECYPPGVLNRFRCGVSNVLYPHVDSRMRRVQSVLKKAVQAIQQHGAGRFGFEQTSERKIRCTIERISEFVQIPVQALLTFISHNMSSGMYFCGSVSFMIYQDLGGMFEVTNPVPVGEWMIGRVTKTSAGLLFVSDMKRYLSVETRDGVSWLREYDGDGVTGSVSLELAPLLASRKVNE